MESPRNMPQQLARIFALALIILAGVLTLHCNTTPLHAQVAEICANGVDDDGDTLIDCADSDCLSGQFLFSGQGIGNSNGKENGFGDVDGDGDIDVMVANNSGPNQLWLNDGNGNFTDSGQLLGN